MPFHDVRMRRAVRPSRQRGAAIIGSLFFILITSILLMGVGTYTTAHQSRAVVDARYAAAINLAEAGLNYEIQKMNVSNGANFDAIGANYTLSSGTTQPLGNGTFRVACTNQDASYTPYTGSASSLYIFSTGIVDGVQRTVRLGAKATVTGGGAWSSPLPTGTTPVNGLLLTSMPSPDPTKKRLWRVRNTNKCDVPFTWQVYGTCQNSSEAANWDGTHNYCAYANKDTYFYTNTELPSDSNPNTTIIYWDACLGGGSGSATKASQTGQSSTLPYSTGTTTFTYDGSWTEINPR